MSSSLDETPLWAYCMSMWLILSLALTLTGCASYGFDEAYRQYNVRPCTHNCWDVLPLSDMRPRRFYDPSRSWQMLRTPSGALYHRYGNMIVGPSGDLTTVY